jgi:hypothetical protein
MRSDVLKMKERYLPIACDAMEIDTEVLISPRKRGVIGSFEIDIHL